MSEKYLIIIDMQNDFIDGSLGTAEAVGILPKVVEKARDFEGRIIFTMDTHGEDYLNTAEGRKLPVIHCVRGTNGWRLADELEKIQKDRNCPVYEKNTFGSVRLAEDLKAINEKEGISSIEIIGLCTDICVVSNALLIKACLPEVPLAADEELCAGVTPEKHKCAVETMRSCQIDI